MRTNSRFHEKIDIDETRSSSSNTDHYEQIKKTNSPAIMPWAPLCPEFDEIVIEMTKELLPNGYNVSENAPQTFDQLVDQMNSGRPMTVWNGASGTTIYGSPEVNYAFRAWHDYIHWQYNLPFTFEGEAAVTMHQVNQLRDKYPNHPKLKYFCALIFSEIMAQIIFEKIQGKFPNNQRRFANKMLDALLDEHPELPS